MTCPYSRIYWLKGEPRIGNPSFSAYVDSLGLSIYRTVNENDLVPHLAPEFLGYKHHGIEYWIDDSAGDVGMYSFIIFTIIRSTGYIFGLKGRC